MLAATSWLEQGMAAVLAATLQLQQDIAAVLAAQGLPSVFNPKGKHTCWDIVFLQVVRQVCVHTFCSKSALWTSSSSVAAWLLSKSVCSS